MRYDGLVEPKSANAFFAASKVFASIFLARCKYAPPVRTGKVLCADEQHISVPKSVG